MGSSILSTTATGRMALEPSSTNGSYALVRIPIIPKPIPTIGTKCLNWCSLREATTAANCILALRMDTSTSAPAMEEVRAPERPAARAEVTTMDPLETVRTSKRFWENCFAFKSMGWHRTRFLRTTRSSPTLTLWMKFGLTDFGIRGAGVSTA